MNRKELRKKPLLEGSQGRAGNNSESMVTVRVESSVEGGAKEGSERLALLLSHLEEPTADQLEGWQDQQRYVKPEVVISPLWATALSPVK